MLKLGVIGNISRDTTEYAGSPHRHLLGGAALYIALAAARAGVAAAPIAVIGADLAEALRLPTLKAMSLDSVAIVDRPSCRFHLRYDQRHILASLDADYGAAELLTQHALDQAPHYGFVHVCCRLPLDPVPVLTALIDRHQPFSVDFIAASAPGMIAATAAFLPYAEFIFTNVSEYELLKRAVDATNLRVVTVTDGPRPVVLYRYGVPVVRTPIVQTKAIEVTGAGDTLTGTFLASMLRGEGRSLALRYAAQAATARVATIGISLR